MSGYWQVWCPVCARSRPTRIPAGAPTTAVTAEYDAHMRRQHGGAVVTWGNRRRVERVYAVQCGMMVELRPGRELALPPDLTAAATSIGRKEPRLMLDSTHAPQACEPSRAVNHTDGA